MMIGNASFVFFSCGGNMFVQLTPTIRTRIVHCAESCRPFELFANENCKLQIEAKMNAMFERGSTRDPRRNPLSAEMNNASA